MGRLLRCCGLGTIAGIVGFLGSGVPQGHSGRRGGVSNESELGKLDLGGLETFYGSHWLYIMSGGVGAFKTLHPALCLTAYLSRNDRSQDPGTEMENVSPHLEFPINR